jgi:ribosome maturation factor RimP
MKNTAQQQRKVGTSTDTFAREKALEREVALTVEHGLPGVEVLAVELLSPSRFCVYLDRREGVDLALCERVTHLLDGYRSQYSIDVSSPGPERPLRKPAHFRGATGSRVRLRIRDESGSHRLRGELLRADERGVTLATTDQELQIPYEAIVRANLIDERRKEP